MHGNLQIMGNPNYTRCHSNLCVVERFNHKVALRLGSKDYPKHATKFAFHICNGLRDMVNWFKLLCCLCCTMRHVATSMQSNGHKYICACGDFNASIDNVFPNENESSIGSFGIGPRTARDSLLTSFVHSEGMLICNCLFQHRIDNTYLFSLHSIIARRIDFVLCGSLLDVVDAWTDSCIWVGNNYQLVHARIRALFAHNI